MNIKHPRIAAGDVLKHNQVLALQATSPLWPYPTWPEFEPRPRLARACASAFNFVGNGEPVPDYVPGPPPRKAQKRRKARTTWERGKRKQRTDKRRANVEHSARRILASEVHKMERAGLPRPTTTHVYMAVKPRREDAWQLGLHRGQARAGGVPAQVFQILDLIKQKARVVRTGKIVSLGFGPGRRWAFHAKHYRIAKAFLAKRVQLKVQKLMKVHGWTEDQARVFLATERYPDAAR